MVSTPSPERCGRVDALLQAYEGAVPGAALLLARDGVVVVRRAWGLADLEAGSAATPATAYRLASVTKPLTATATLLLVQEGRLSLQARVREWLPALPPAAADVTVRQLLSHTSGLVDYEELIPPGTRQPLRDADVLRLLARSDRTYFAPGSRYRYSDSGYALLALLIAQVSGMDFASFLRRRIFEPLAMHDSVALEEGISTLPRRAFGYSRSGAAWARTDQSLTSAVLGDGGVYSSVDDLAKWDAALCGGRLLQDAARELAVTPVTDTDDPQVRYGLGWRLTGASEWHSGETLGFRNAFVRWPRARLTAIVLTNRGDGDPYSLALAAAKLFLPEADAVRASRVVVGPDPGAHPLPEHSGA